MDWMRRLLARQRAEGNLPGTLALLAVVASVGVGFTVIVALAFVG
jgi:hypothetical protein